MANIMADDDAIEHVLSGWRRVLGRGRKPLCFVCNTYAGELYHSTFPDFKICTECAREFVRADFEEVDDDGNEVCCSVCGGLEEDRRPCQQDGCTRSFCVECLVSGSLFALDRKTLPEWGEEFACPMCADPVDQDSEEEEEEESEEEESAPGEPDVEEEVEPQKKRKSASGTLFFVTVYR